MGLVELRGFFPLLSSNVLHLLLLELLNSGETFILVGAFDLVSRSSISIRYAVILKRIASNNTVDITTVLLSFALCKSNDLSLHSLF